MALEFPNTSVSLLAKLGAGDNNPAAWGRFVVTYGPHIIRWCRKAGLQDSDADDVAQEILLQLSRQIGRFRYDPERRFRGWLRMVVRGALHDWASKRREWHQGRGDDLVLRQLDADAAREDLLAQIEIQYDHEVYEIASRAVRNRVEPRTWEAFHLLAVEGLAGKEAAARTGMKLATTFAARLKVQRMIRETMELIDPPE